MSIDESHAIEYSEFQQLLALEDGPLSRSLWRMVGEWVVKYHVVSHLCFLWMMMMMMMSFNHPHRTRVTKNRMTMSLIHPNNSMIPNPLSHHRSWPFQRYRFFGVYWWYGFDCLHITRGGEIKMGIQTIRSQTYRWVTERWVGCSSFWF